MEDLKELVDDCLSRYESGESVSQIAESLELDLVSEIQRVPALLQTEALAVERVHRPQNGAVNKLSLFRNSSVPLRFFFTHGQARSTNLASPVYS